MPKRLFASLLVLLLLLSPTRSQSQTNRWQTIEQPAAWYSLVVERPLTDRVSLWFDGQWRRSGLIDNPQQLLLRPGVMFTLTPSVRVGGGYAWIATAPYGETPSLTPLREHRAWQQLSLTHRAAGLGISHRYRWEQRWLTPVRDSGAAVTSYQQRARYLVRAQGVLPRLRLGKGEVTGFVWNEVLLPVGHGDALIRLTQNRLGGGIGVPVSPRNRIEVGYMHLWNSLTASRVNEVNLTLTLSWLVK